MSLMAGRIRPSPGGWFVVKITFRERDQDVDLVNSYNLAN